MLLFLGGQAGQGSWKAEKLITNILKHFGSKNIIYLPGGS